MSIADLQISLQNVLKQNAFSIESLKQLLDPLPIYSTSPIFQNNINEVLNIIIKDRDNDTKFTVNDITLFVKDPMALAALTTSLLLILNGILTNKITYDVGNTEKLVLKLIVYVFLVILPNFLKINFTNDEKVLILNTSLLIYDAVIQSQMLPELTKKVANWFKTKGFCKCFSVNDNVVDEKMPEVKRELNFAIINARKQEDIMSKLNNLIERK